MSLNARALSVVQSMLAQHEELRIRRTAVEGGGQVIDCGIEVPGGLAAGLGLARACLADLGQVILVPGEIEGQACPHVQVVTDHPVRACLASQYAGWAIRAGKYFAMGSGPMRAAAAQEPLFETLDYRERPDIAVGILEGRTVPDPEVVALIARACGVPPDAVTLLIAPTASLAGGLQVVARSIETALHQLHEHGFDLGRVVSAHGSAPLPPVADDDLAAIGRTNDAILYGARVNLFVTGEDSTLLEVGHKVPSSSSKDYGEPFAAIFARYNHDFYAVDPHLFSPAEVIFQNLTTGRVHRFGQIAPDVLARSFFHET